MLHSDGWQVLKNAVCVSPQARRALRLQLRGAHAIFNYNEQSEANDHLRTQARLRPKKNADIAAFCSSVSGAVPFLGRRACREWVVIRSEAGCQRQHRHRDFDPAAVCGLADDDIPLAVIVGLDSDAKLVVWPTCIRGKTPAADDPGTIITFGTGDVVVFRGDLVHAGAAYPEKCNVRVHSYVDAPGVKRKNDRTYLC